MLTIGQKAPDFTLLTGDNASIRLSDFLGKKVVLYFYSKDSTAGCTKQAVGFSEIYDALKDKNVEIIGISKDSITSHERFSEKYNLPFFLASDPELNVIKAYDVLHEKKMCGKVGMGVVRTTFIIDENGYIENIFNNVKSSESKNDIACYFGL